MGIKWKVPVLTQIILLLFEYINVKPRFYTRERVAQALAEYLCGLSSWRVSLPHSTLLYFRRLGYVRYVVSLSYAVDETKVLSVKGEYYVDC